MLHDSRPRDRSKVKVMVTGDGGHKLVKIAGFIVYLMHHYARDQKLTVNCDTTIQYLIFYPTDF